jgi:hypothetical protein
MAVTLNQDVEEVMWGVGGRQRKEIDTEGYVKPPQSSLFWYPFLVPLQILKLTRQALDSRIKSGHIYLPDIIKFAEYRAIHVI